MSTADLGIPGAGPTSADYTVDELMVATLARQLDDDDQVVNGAASFIPVCAFALARATHAPKLVWLAGAVGLDPRPRRIPASTLEAPLWHRSSMYMPQLEDFWSYVLNGRWLTKFCVRGAQIDQYGNANNSVIGLATTPTLNPNSPSYHWTDDGLVFQSTSTDDYNAIDP